LAKLVRKAQLERMVLKAQQVRRVHKAQPAQQDLMELQQT
jgi:hypothetical protein